MQLDITRFFRLAEPSDFSASVAELGANAGRITWGNAMREAAESPFLATDEELEAARDYFAAFGAWDEEEMASWTKQHVNAMVVQEIAYRIREAEFHGLDIGDTRDDGAWAEYERLSDAGQVSGCLYRSGEGVFISLTD